MAAALVKGADAGSLEGLYCPVGGTDVMGQVADLLGMAVANTEPKVAVVRCNGTCELRPRIAEYEVYYNSILASPFCCLIVVGIAIPFAVSGVRVNPMVGVSKSIGLFAAYYLLTNIFNMLGAGMWLPPVVAAWAPNVLMLAYAIYLCRKRADNVAVG